MRAADDAFGGLHGDAVEDRQPALIAWPAVPIELVWAAGLWPVLVHGGTAPTPSADAHLENAGFPNRIRQLIEAVFTGRFGPGSPIVLPRTSDPDYRAFLYLREFVRRGLVRRSGPILLFDLLQSAGGDVPAYNAARARGLLAALGAPDEGPSLRRLREQIAWTNAARAALRRVMALRGSSPRISGVEALPLIRAFWRLAPDVYAPLAIAAAESLARRQPLDGPRVLLLGAPVDGPALHAAIEAHGAIVVAEPGPWGSGAAGEDVAVGGDPFAALAAKYRRDAWGPRTAVAECRRWIAGAVPDADAVVVSLPPDDAVFGWDYPWIREQLRQQGVPHICVTHDPCMPVPDADRDRLANLVSVAAPRLEARRG